MNGLIELRFNNKWKWAAMDEIGEWFFYRGKPNTGLTEWMADEGTFAEIFSIEMPLLDWRDSLHEIINQDGRVYLRKYVDIPAAGEPVIVWDIKGCDFRRYSAGKTTDTGRLLCYNSGSTKWSQDGSYISWVNWRRPTPEELEGAR